MAKKEAKRKANSKDAVHEGPSIDHYTRYTLNIDHYTRYTLNIDHYTRYTNGALEYSNTDEQVWSKSSAVQDNVQREAGLTSLS